MFVVDDDPRVVGSIQLLLRSHGYVSEGFVTAEPLLTRTCDVPACVLLDLWLGERNGLEVQDDLRRRGFTQPIIFLSGQGDVPSAARAMREGALDFLVKPVDEKELLDALARATDVAHAQQATHHARREAAGRLARLTTREREVCDLIARGLLNKQIAYELRSSENTIKVHRARVMRKLQVDSVAALVRLVSMQ